MRIRWLIIAGLLTVCWTAFAQTGTVRGVVQDRESGEALSGANVEVTELSRGTPTDEDGTFVLRQIPAGRYTLEVTFLGYRKSRTALEVQADTTHTLSLTLEPSPILGKEITVVATRAIEGETPAPFSTLTKEDLEVRYYAQDIPVMLSELPSTTFYSESGNGIGYNYMSIRGFDQRRISVMINGIPQNDPEDHNVYWVDFPDFLGNVEDIQVQRGAGSAFYGPPAIGGSVNIITSGFSPDRRLSLYSGGGTYGTQKFSLGANTGLIKDRFVISARVSQIKSDGYRDHSAVDFKSYFLGAAYFGERSSARLHFYGGPIEDQLAYFGISKEAAEDPQRRRENPIKGEDEIENFNQPHLSLIHTYQVNDQLTLNNTLFGIRGYGFFDYDGSWAPFSYFRLTPEFGFDVSGNPVEQFASDVLIRAYVDNRQVGWLPNIVWEHARGQLVAGSEVRFHRSLHWGRIQDGNADLPPAVSGDYRGLNYIGERRYYEYNGAKDILSPYLQSSYRLGSRVNLNAALQFLYQRYRLYDEAFIGTDFEIDYTFLNPRLGITYLLSPQTNLFVSLSRTAREPRLKNFYDAAEASTPASWGAVVPQFQRNPDGSFNFDKPLVKPEKLTDLEVGVHYRNSHYFGHLNLFYMDFQDEIVKSGQLDRFGQPITGNADRSLHAGIELSGGINLTPALTMEGNLTYSNNELKDYSIFETGENGQPVEIVLDGNAIAGFPDFLANAKLTYRKSGLSAAVLMQHVGKKYTDNLELQAHTVDPYTVFHGTLGYDLGRWLPAKGFILQLHVRNIFDTLYITHGEGTDFFPAAERHFFANVKVEL